MGLDNPLHIAFLLIVLLLVFGAKRLPEIGRSIGTGMREFKDSISGISNDHQHVLTQPQAQVPAPPAVQAPVAQPVQAPVAQPAQAPVAQGAPQAPAAPQQAVAAPAPEAQQAEPAQRA